jgi:hypothetical protein
MITRKVGTYSILRQQSMPLAETEDRKHLIFLFDPSEITL